METRVWMIVGIEGGIEDVGGLLWGIRALEVRNAGMLGARKT